MIRVGEPEFPGELMCASVDRSSERCVRAALVTFEVLVWRDQHEFGLNPCSWRASGVHPLDTISTQRHPAMPQAPKSLSIDSDAAVVAAAAADDLVRASSPRPRTTTFTPSRPTVLLTKSWTSATVLPSTTSTRITVGANTSTATDAASSISQHEPSTSSNSTRASTPLPELSPSPFSPQTAVAEALTREQQPAGPSDDSQSRSILPHASDHSTPCNSDQATEVAFHDAADVEPEAVGTTVSSSIHALDLLHRVNDRAAAERASNSESLRSHLSRLSVSRASSKHRSRSNSRDASTQTRALPPAFLGTKQAAPSAASAVTQTSLRDEAKDGDRQLYDTSSAPSHEEEQYPDRKYYILSSAGKPIYISHASLSRRKRRREKRRRQRRAESNESDLNSNESDEEDESSTTQVGVMQALISIFADEDSDKLRFIRRGDLLITFLLRAPLYLVCVSSWNEEPSTLRQHLEYLYLQVISLVSASQLTRLFGRMPNFDLRRLLEGTEGIFDYLVNQLNANETEDDDAEQGQHQVATGGVEAKRAVTDWASCHQWWLQALQPIRITVPNLRDQLTAALQPPTAEAGSSTQPHRPKDLLYVLLCANGRIVTLLRPRKHSVHPIDLLLLTNMVMGSRSIKRSGGSEDAEIWLPLSMPKFAPHGFVHAYVKFLDPESWIGSRREGSEMVGDAKMTSSELAVIVVTGDKDAFPTVSAWISSLVAQPPAHWADNTADDAGDAGDAGSIRTTDIMAKRAASKKQAGKSAKPTQTELASWMTHFQRHILTLCRHLTDASNIEQGSPRVSAYTCAELGLAGLRHFVYRSNSTIQLTSPSLPDPYASDAVHRKRLLTLYSLVHHQIHHPLPASASHSESSSSSTTAPPTGMLNGVFGTPASSHPRLSADTRLKMHLVKSHHEQILGWITSPFELYLCLNPQLSKSAIVAVANSLTKWIKSNENDLFLVNAGSF